MRMVIPIRRRCSESSEPFNNCPWTLLDSPQNCPGKGLEVKKEYAAKTKIYHYLRSADHKSEQPSRAFTGQLGDSFIPHDHDLGASLLKAVNWLTTGEVILPSKGVMTPIVTRPTRVAPDVPSSAQAQWSGLRAPVRSGTPPPQPVMTPPSGQQQLLLLSQQMDLFSLNS